MCFYVCESVTLKNKYLSIQVVRQKYWFRCLTESIEAWYSYRGLYTFMVSAHQNLKTTLLIIPKTFPKTKHQEDRNQSQSRYTSFYNYYILKWSWVHFLQKLAELHIPSSSGSSNGLRWLGWRSTSGSSKGLLFMAGAVSWSSSSRKFSLLISSVAKEFNKKSF